MNSQAHLSATTVENISQQASTKPRQTRNRKTPPPVKKALAIVDTLIIGAGFAGLGSAIRLKQAGLENLLIIERSDKVGGTWRDNTYPGAACDIPSNLYSYSFAQNPNWSRGFSNSSEILGYIHYLVDHFKLSNLIKFNQNVSSLSFDEQTGLWTVALVDGEFYQARTVISAAGPLSNFSFPKIAGLENFKGKKSTVQTGIMTIKLRVSGLQSSALALVQFKLFLSW